MSSRFEGLVITISGPLAEIARFQPLLQELDGTLTLSAAIGNDDGRLGVLQWSGRFARPKPFGLRGPRKPK